MGGLGFGVGRLRVQGFGFRGLLEVSKVVND